MAEQSASGASVPATAVSGVQDPKQQPQAQQSGEKKPPAAAPPLSDFRSSKHKIKVHDKESEVDYDTLIRLAQKGTGADEVFRSAAAKEKKFAALLDRAKEGDLDWIEEIAGPKAREWAEKRLLREIELEQMSPEKREAMKERARAEKAEKELKTREEREQDAKMESFRQAAAQEIDTKLDEAFKKAGLPMTPSRIERVAQYLDASLSVDGALLDPAKAIARVQAEMRADAREILESLSAADLREFLPRKVLDAIRKGDVEDARAQDPLRRTTQDAPPRRITDAKQKRMSTDDYFNKLEKKFGG